MTTTISNGEFTRVPSFVSPEICVEWVEILVERRQEWTERLGFHTFGNAWYAEIATGHLPTYHVTAEAANARVAALPGFRQAMASVAKHLKSPAGGPAGPARPRRQNLGPYWCDAGLHILGRDSSQGGVAHVDLEGLAPYPETLFDEATSAFSAVLCVAAPARGGDLLIWPSRRILARESATFDVDPSDATRLPCATGDLLLFDSFLPHQIDGFQVDETAPFRITGVMHFLWRQAPEPHWEYWF